MNDLVLVLWKNNFFLFSRVEESMDENPLELLKMLRKAVGPR